MAELFATIMLQVSSILLSNEDTCAYRRVYLFNFLKKEMTAKAYRLIIKKRNPFSGAVTNTFTVV